jgi:hypothetical protein
MNGPQKFLRAIISDGQRRKEISDEVDPDDAHAIQACFVRHIQQKAQDYTFSTCIP